MNSIPAYVTSDYLASLSLRGEPGTGAPGDRCAIQEVRAWLDLDASTDEIPGCVSPLVGTLVIRTQDASKAWRDELRDVLPLLVGSRGSDALEWRRVYRVLDWSVREAMPAGLDTLATEIVPHDEDIAGSIRSDATALRALALALSPVPLIRELAAMRDAPIAVSPAESS
jgi:hypothetical protein